MAPERIDPELAPGPLQHLNNIATAQHQGLAKRRQSPLKIQQRFTTKQPLPFGGVGLLP
jgi:hypothetical protein